MIEGITKENSNYIYDRILEITNLGVDGSNGHYNLILIFGYGLNVIYKRIQTNFISSIDLSIYQSSLMELMELNY